MKINYAQRYINLLISINFLIILGAGFMTPVWAEFVKQIGGDLRTAGNAICIFSIILGFFTWITAKIEHHLKQDEKIIVIAQALFAISYSGYFFVHAPWQLYLVQIALGVSGAIQVPALFALYQRFIPHQHETLYWGIWNGFYNIAMGVGALISAYTVHRYGFKTMFVLLFSSAVICFFMTAVTARHILHKNRTT